MIYSADVNTTFLNIVTGVLQGDTLVPCMFTICLDYVLLNLTVLIKENGFTLKTVRSTQYFAETMKDADDLTLLANTPAQTKSLLHSLQQAAGGIGLYVNANKTEFMYFK